MNARTRRLALSLPALALLLLGSLAAAPAFADGTTPAVAPVAPAAKTAPTSDDPAAALQKALQVEDSVIKALAQVRKHSVSVLHLARPTPTTLALRAVGSGVIVSKANKLWVITNVHVVAGAAALQVVTSDGATWDVEVADKVAQYDFALLRFVEKPKGLSGVTIKKDASRALAEGAWVLATGNPFYLSLDGQPVCTLGAISGVDRILGGEYLYGNAIQHDAEVNPGNSGGPLWNSKGELVGINGKIAMRPGPEGAGPCNSGASFSIPIHQVAGFMDQLVKEGAPTQAGFLGLDVETAVDQAGNPLGARIVKVADNSPARYEAPKPGEKTAKGLNKGDVILRISFAGSPVTVKTAADLTNALVLHPADTKVTISYLRDKKPGTWIGALGKAG
jgi:S1-C subfamily serine protease